MSASNYWREKGKQPKHASDATGNNGFNGHLSFLFRPARKIGELHIVLGLEDLGPVNLQQLMGDHEVSFLLF